MKAYTFAELDEKVTSEKEARITSGRWGQWHYDPKNNTLTHQAEQYEIDLDTATTLEKAVGWILHIRGKVWCDANVLWDLTQALEDLACESLIR